MSKGSLHSKYIEVVIPELKKQLGRDNVHAIPKLEKIVVSMGLGGCSGDRKRIDEAVGHLSQIAGQRPVVTRSKKAVSGFRLREGVEVGCCVTLRKSRMFEFLERLVDFALPRVRDFRGLNPKSFDGRGNYSFGLNEQLVFPEVDPDKVSFVQGMNVAIVTTAANDDEGRLLLRSLGVPFSRE